MLSGMRAAGLPPDDLVAYLTRTTSLSPGEAARVIADVLGYFAEPAEDYVRRRHGELKARGLTNDQAFERITAELPLRRFQPPPHSLPPPPPDRFRLLPPAPGGAPAAPGGGAEDRGARPRSGPLPPPEPAP